MPTKYTLEELQENIDHLSMEILAASRYTSEKPQEKLDLHTFHELQIIARAK